MHNILDRVFPVLFDHIITYIHIRLYMLFESFVCASHIQKNLYKQKSAVKYRREKKNKSKNSHSWPKMNIMITCDSHCALLHSPYYLAVCMHFIMHFLLFLIFCNLHWYYCITSVVR